MKIKVSQAVKDVARVSFESQKIIRSVEEFDVFEIPPGSLKEYALLSFREGINFSKDGTPSETLIMPVNIDNRIGYILDKKIALSVDSES